MSHFRFLLFKQSKMDQDKSVIFEEHMDTINRYLTQVLITLSFGRRNPVGSAPSLLEKAPHLRWIAPCFCLHLPTLPRGVPRCWPLLCLLILIQISLFKVWEKDQRIIELPYPLVFTTPSSKKVLLNRQPEALCCDGELPASPREEQEGGGLEKRCPLCLEASGFVV